MANPLDATIKTAIAAPITQPYFLVAIGWDTPAYYSTVGQISWSSITWVATSLKVTMGESPQLRFFNDSLSMGTLVLAQGTAGRIIQIYQGYQNDSAHPSPEYIFRGELGTATIGEYVDITCKRFPPKKTPRHYCTQPTFNHLPKTGTRFETPGGVVILEAR